MGYFKMKKTALLFPRLSDFNSGVIVTTEKALILLLIIVTELGYAALTL